MKEQDKKVTGKKSPVKIILIIFAVIVSLILVLFASAYFYTKSQIILLKMYRKPELKSQWELRFTESQKSLKKITS